MKLHAFFLAVSSLVATGALSLPGRVQADTWGLPPAEACSLLADVRLAARGEYRRSGNTHQCRSARRNITGSNDVAHDIRFVAQGDAEAVLRLRLDLRVNSRSGVQRALSRLADNADLMTQRALGEALPMAVRQAIVGAVAGEWRLSARTLTLTRITAGSGLFELRFSIH